MAFLRFILLMAVPLGVIYISVLAWLCARQRERLNAEYQPGATERARAAFVQAGVSAYAARIRRPLAGLIFGVPFGALAIYIFVTNF